MTHSAPFPDLWPSRQAVKNIFGTGEKLLAAINQYRANPSTLAPRNAVYHETKGLEKLLNPRGLSSDDPERNHFDSKGWPIVLLKGFSKISFSVDAILHVCNWENNGTPFGDSTPTGPADIHGSLFSGVTVIVPLNLKSISDNHVSKLEEGLELLQKALASVEHLPPTADEWVESTKGEGNGGKKRRGRQKKEETQPLAQFAKPHVDNGLGWAEIAEEYITKHPKKAKELLALAPGEKIEEDSKRGLADKIRHAYNSEYPP